MTLDPLLATRIVRREWSRIVSTAMRICGDLDLAEDAAQDALLRAVQTWPQQGLPANPGAWLTTVVRRRALNLLRSKKRRREVGLLADVEQPAHPAAQDDRLALLLLCCHPALSHDGKVTLTLRLAGGLSTREIARGLLLADKTVGQRISRAKRTLRSQQEPFEQPGPEQLAARMQALLEVVYLIFNEGYFSGSAEPIRSELVWDAVMLARQLTELLPTHPEVWALAALVQFKSARSATRVTVAGELVPLDEQDRRRWDRDAIAEAERCRAAAVGCARQGAAVGRYLLQAEIEAHHCRAERFEDTRWDAIEQLYEALVTLSGNAVAELGWVVARSYARSPQAGLQLLSSLGTEHRLPGYSIATATRADLLRRASRLEEAWQLYQSLSERTEGPAERRFYQRRLRECAQ